MRSASPKPSQFHQAMRKVKPGVPVSLVDLCFIITECLRRRRIRLSKRARDQNSLARRSDYSFTVNDKNIGKEDIYDLKIEKYMSFCL